MVTAVGPKADLSTNDIKVGDNVCVYPWIGEFEFYTISFYYSENRVKHIMYTNLLKLSGIFQI